MYTIREGKINQPIVLYKFIEANAVHLKPNSASHFFLQFDDHIEVSTADPERMESRGAEDDNCGKQGNFLLRVLGDVDISEVPMRIGANQMEGGLDEIVGSMKLRQRNNLGVPNYG